MVEQIKTLGPFTDTVRNMVRAMNLAQKLREDPANEGLEFTVEPRAEGIIVNCPFPNRPPHISDDLTGLAYDALYDDQPTPHPDLQPLLLQMMPDSSLDFGRLPPEVWDLSMAAADAYLKAQHAPHENSVPTEDISDGFEENDNERS